MQKVLSLGTRQFGFILLPAATLLSIFTGTVGEQQARAALQSTII